ncbi:PIG-L family deacetylase [Kineococcus glutinatus]|uniref:LmbE family N-acetylglucosaminyl deacetylase n=1 Tax=Kineococcus glutinatus TaxID=1070872 RepID=A0ABP9H9D9_9ACTN
MPIPVLTRSMAAPADVLDPAVFLVPHADDETLTMGPAIEEQLNAGRYVLVVLVTDGRASGVRALTGLSHEEFSLARDREFLAACAALGVPQEQVFLARCVDGRLDAALAACVVGTWVRLFPGGAFRTTTWTDAHADHAALGAALRDLAPLVPGGDVRFYVKPPEWDSPVARPPVREERTSTRRYLAACDEYARVDHAAGRWGIGQLSVAGSFALRRASDASRWHGLA